MWKVRDACSSPFCQVMAGRGAPEVSQCRITDMPSITVLSEGPAVMFGAIPLREKRRLNEKRRRETSTNTRWRSDTLYGRPVVCKCQEIARTKYIK